MEITYRNIVSRIQNIFKGLTKDTYIPRRLILSIYKSKAEHFLLQKLNEKKMFDNQDIFQWINCIRLEEDSPVKCGIPVFSECRSLMKSVKKIPDIINTDYGYAIIMATNIDHSKTYDLKSIRYINEIKNSPHYSLVKGKYFYIVDGYIYIPDSEVEVINLLALSLDEKKDECSECSENSECSNYWETKINLPKKFVDLAVSQTIQEVAMRLHIPKDELPNLDSNQKIEKVQ